MIVQKIIAVLDTYPTIHTVYLHGSQADGSAAIGSDVDLAVIGKASLDQLLTIRQQLHAVLDKDIDIAHIKTDTDPLFAHRVFNQGKRIIDRQPAKRIALETQLEMMYFDTAHQREQATESSRHILGVV